MNSHDSILILRCEQAFHPGTGAGIGIIDKPIQRSVATELPVFWDSGLKGSLKDAGRSDSRLTGTEHQMLFGSDDNGSIPAAGLFTEANVLLFPVRSAKGLFTWITCPYVLNRFFRSPILHSKIKTPRNFVNPASQLEAFRTNPGTWNDIKVIKQKGSDYKAGIEEFILHIKEDDNYTGLSTLISDFVFPDNNYAYWKMHLTHNLLVVSNELFRHLAIFDTELRTRNRIDIKTGVAAGTALFVTEYLPEFTVLYAMATVIGADANNLTSKLRQQKSTLLAGGNITIGKGQLNLHMIYERSEPQA